MAIDPVCKMKVDEKDAAGQDQLQRQRLFLLLKRLRTEV